MQQHGLELVSEWLLRQFAPADEGAGEMQQASVQVGVALVAGPESFELVEPGEGAFHDPAPGAQARAVCGAPAGDLGGDAPGA